MHYLGRSCTVVYTAGVRNSFLFISCRGGYKDGYEVGQKTFYFQQILSSTLWWTNRVETQNLFLNKLLHTTPPVVLVVDKKRLGDVTVCPHVKIWRSYTLWWMSLSGLFQIYISVSPVTCNKIRTGLLLGKALRYLSWGSKLPLSDVYCAERIS
jgi:hypothetical protein